MMDTKNTIEKNKLERIKIIFDNDAGILDFLCELTDRSIISGLQEFVQASKDKPGIFISNCPFDSLVVLILYKSPFDFNNDQNDLILYAHNNLKDMTAYFKKILGETSKDSPEIYNALDDITRILFWEMSVQEDNNASCNHMG